MSFQTLKRRVHRAERQVQACEEHMHTELHKMGMVWRAGWTPWRIVLAGLAGGFILGHARPLASIGRFAGMGWTQWIGATTSLWAGIQTILTQVAGFWDAPETPSASGDVPDAAASATDTSQQAPSSQAPQPAEAATEISEADTLHR